MSDADPPDGGASDGLKPKKTKIDLKSRLSSVRATGSIPMVPRDSADPLSFPPPAVQGSVPPPRMLSQAAAAYMPTPAPSMFAAPAAPPPQPTAQQQIIKVEEGEIIEERRRAQKSARVYIGLAAVVSLVLGGLLGMLVKGGEQGRTAVKGAQSLAKDIEDSVKVLGEFSDALAKGQEGFGNEQFPDELATFMRAKKVPFDASKFEGRGVGAYPKDLFTSLIKFTKGVEDFNKKVDRLSGQLSNVKVKDGISKYWANKKDPVVNFSIFLDKRGEDYFALLVPNKEPFAQKKPAPAEYSVTKPPAGQEKEGQQG